MGGGKSEALLIEALSQVHLPHYRGILFRKTYPQLAKLIDKSLQYYKRMFPGAKYNESKHVWTFPSGAKIYFGSMQHANDRYNYQGIDYEFIGFDELTHFSYDEYSYLWTRNRPNGPGGKCYIRATANPGGIGHGWVKNRFITPAPPYTTMLEETKYTDPNGKMVRKLQSRIFIPATVFDNPAMLANDPTYLDRLASLPERERKAALYGDWDTYAGQVFIEWRNNPDAYQSQELTHVIDPFRIPGHWKLWCAMDWGYAKPFAVGWYAVDELGCVYHIKEFYGCEDGEKDPDKGIRMDVATLGKEIKRIEAEDPVLRGKPIMRVADPAICIENGGISIQAELDKQGLYFEKGDNSRLAGWAQYHKRLAFDAEGHAMFYVFKGCRNFIRTFPDLTHDEKHPEDVNSKLEDHAPDQGRYMLMANPCPARKIVVPKPRIYEDPLNLQPHNQKRTMYL